MVLPDFESEYSDLFGTIRKVVPPSMKIYLVGGAVRDILLGRPIRDFDFTAEGLVRPIGKSIAKTLNGAYYVLDDEREMVRVIIDDPDSGQYDIDIALMNDNDIESDLRERDFTINAMAIALEPEPYLVDPLGGEQDLKNKKLSMCAPESLENDPMRGMRAIRMSLEFGLEMDPELTAAMKEVAGSLDESSFERYRDELFKILRLHQNHKAFELIGRFGFLDYLFEGWNLDYARTHDRLIRDTDLFLCLLTNVNSGVRPSDPYMEMAVNRLGNYMGACMGFYDKTLSLYHSRRMLTAFAAAAETLSAADPDLVQHWCTRLTFSSAESAFVQQAIRSHRCLMESADDTAFEDVDIYRYFRRYKEGGIAGLLLYLADKYALCRENSKIDEWQRCIDFLDRMAGAYFTRNL